jgi:hypothetical protein
MGFSFVITTAAGWVGMRNQRITRRRQRVTPRVVLFVDELSD